MSADTGYSHPKLRSRKSSLINPPPATNPGHSGPTTFFLRSEKDMEKSAGTSRGRCSSIKQISQGDIVQEDTAPPSRMMQDSSFAVQSLEDAIGVASPSTENALSSTASNASQASTEAAAAEPSVVAGRKRKAGNPIHPKILATAQRILSSEHTSTQASSAASPASRSSSRSPFGSHIRRASISSINLSQPLTPLRLSPQPESGIPGTPCSASLRSFRLSDEEGSVMDETGSQAIQSSSGEEEDEGFSTQETTSGAAQSGSSIPELVMPSIAMPARRPFTEKGRRMGGLQVAVAGPAGVGKTSLIRSIIRICEDIVHVDPPIGTADSPTVTEVHASTKPYPQWWSDVESSRILSRRKSSIGDGVLERNLCFIDPPSLGNESDGMTSQAFVDWVQRVLAVNNRLESLTDNELLHLLSGKPSIKIDLVLYMFGPDQAIMPVEELEALRQLCEVTNVLPLIGRADTVSTEDIKQRKLHILDTLTKAKFAQPPFGFEHTPDSALGAIGEGTSVIPFAVSSAFGDDADTMDASVLMSSEYLQPLLSSELSYLVERLFEPDNMSRLRHLSARKFLQWRRERAANKIDSQKQMLLQQRIGFGVGALRGPAVTATGSVLSESGQILVPHSDSSYYRSNSPSAASAASNAAGGSAFALARYRDDQINNTERFQQVRLAKWAQDLQRSLDNERRRYKDMYAASTAPWHLGSNNGNDTSDDEGALVKHECGEIPSRQSQKPAKGRLGGQLGVIDPQDPLGVLAFQQRLRKRGWFVLQIAGSFGVLGAFAYWVTRNWADVQEFFGFNQPIYPPITAAPPPAKRLLDYLDDLDWRGMVHTAQRTAGTLCRAHGGMFGW